MSRRFRKPNQIIQPYQFGHEERKTACLWLRGLAKLEPTKIVEPQIVTLKNGKTFSKMHNDTWHSPSEERQRVRSETFQGIADAMAEQWGGK